MTDPRLTRYGILGFGHHAAKRLIPAFRGAQRAQLTGLWRRDQAKAAENARDFSIPHNFATAEELCASPEIDAVFVVSPDSLHLEHTLLALKHGKPVLCEKPLAMNTAQAEQMLSAADKAGVLLGVAQNMRYNESIARMRQWIAEGRIGAPQIAHAQFCYETARSPRAWINDPALARGGPIGDVGIHCIDALCFVLGGADSLALSGAKLKTPSVAKVEAVTTLAHRHAEADALESHAIIALDFAGGAMGVATVTGRAAYRSYLEVTGATGVLTCEYAMTIENPVHLVHRENGEIATDELVSNAAAFSRMLDSFAAAISGTEAYLASGNEGLVNQRVLDAAYQSWTEGRRIALTSAE